MAKSSQMPARNFGRMFCRLNDSPAVAFRPQHPACWREGHHVSDRSQFFSLSTILEFVQRNFSLGRFALAFNGFPEAATLLSFFRSLRRNGTLKIFSFCLCHNNHENTVNALISGAIVEMLLHCKHYTAADRGSDG